MPSVILVVVLSKAVYVRVLIYAAKLAEEEASTPVTW